MYLCHLQPRLLANGKCKSASLLLWIDLFSMPPVLSLLKTPAYAFEPWLLFLFLIHSILSDPVLHFCVLEHTSCICDQTRQLLHKVFRDFQQAHQGPWLVPRMDSGPALCLLTELNVPQCGCMALRVQVRRWWSWFGASHTVVLCHCFSDSLFYWDRKKFLVFLKTWPTLYPSFERRKVNTGWWQNICGKVCMWASSLTLKLSVPDHFYWSREKPKLANGC